LGLFPFWRSIGPYFLFEIRKRKRKTKENGGETHKKKRKEKTIGE